MLHGRTRSCSQVCMRSKQQACLPTACPLTWLVLAVLAAGLIPGLDQYASVLDIPYFLLLATFSVFIAAHRSLTAPRQQITLSQASPGRSVPCRCCSRP